MFEFCDGSDPLLKEMVGRGVNILMPPLDVILAGDLVLAEKGRGARRADWQAVLGCDPVRDVVHSEGFESATFQHSAKLNAGGAFSLAGRALQAFGWPEGHLGAKLGNVGAEAVEISLTAPAFDTLTDVDAVVGALTAANAQLLPAYKGRRLLLVAKVWRAKGLRMRLHAKSKISAEAVAAAAKELSGKADLVVETDQLATMHFKARQPLVFGVGLRELALSAEGYWTDITPTKHYSLRTDEADVELDQEVRYAFIDEASPFVGLARD